MAKTDSKKGSTTALAKNMDIKNMSFEEIMGLDEKELNKQMSYQQKMIGKKSQLQAKVIDLTMKKEKAEQKFKTSLVDPTIDSVELRLEIDCLEKEIQVAKMLMNQLFPNG